MTQYAVKINRREGALEVIGDKAWVDEKLLEFAAVYAEAPADEGEHARARRASATGKRPQRKRTNTEGETTKPPRRRNGRPQKNAELATKLTSQVKHKVQDYRDARSTAFEKKAPNAVAIIAGALRDELEMTEVSEDDIHTVYSVMGWPAPNITKAMENAYERDHYLGGLHKGNRELTQAGETFARHGSVNET
jgi:hypothetical protein